MDSLLTNSSEVKKLTSYKRLQLWNNERTMSWLTMSCPQQVMKYEHEFIKHQIDGRVLLGLNDKKLRQIGIASSYDREYILYYVLKLRIKMRVNEIDRLDLNYESTGDSNPSLNE